MQPSPVADHYVSSAHLYEEQPSYPLDLYLCLDCGHVQNLDIVDPEALFRVYSFRTSSSAGLVQHYRKYADDIVGNFALPHGSFIVEIGSNDGSLLQFFRDQGMKVLGVDPATDIARQASEKGIPTLPEFFSADLANRILSEHGPAAIVAANNVFAHADGLDDVVKGVNALLSDRGVFVFEVSYLIDIVDRFLFDTIYHEHVSYHSVAPLTRFFDRRGMGLFDVQHNASKGGSIRGFAQRRTPSARPVTPSVHELIALEKTRGFEGPTIYAEYAKRIAARKAALLELIDGSVGPGGTVAGYGASTTVTTLMYQFALAGRLDFLVDDNPQKHHLFSPGAHIPVLPSESLYERRPGLVVILAWQYALPIIKRHKRFLREGGRFVIPLPTPRVITERELTEFE